MKTQLLLFFLSPLLKWVTITYAIGAAGLALFFLTPGWFPSRFRNTAGIVGICALCGGSFYWYAFHAGERHMAQRIAAKDQEAIARVEQGMREVDECGAENWNVVTGTCGGLR